MSDLIIDGIAVVGGLLVVGGVFLLCGLPAALITAGSLMIALALKTAKVHGAINATDSE